MIQIIYKLLFGLIGLVYIVIIGLTIWFIKQKEMDWVWRFLGTCIILFGLLANTIYLFLFLDMQKSMAMLA